MSFGTKAVWMLGFVLAACGGDSDPPEPAPPGPLPLKILTAVPDGAWHGTWLDPANQQENEVRAFFVDREALQIAIEPRSRAQAALFSDAPFIVSVEQCCVPGQTVSARTMNAAGETGTATVNATFGAGRQDVSVHLAARVDEAGADLSSSARWRVRRNIFVGIPDRVDAGDRVERSSRRHRWLRLLLVGHRCNEHVRRQRVQDVA